MRAVSLFSGVGGMDLGFEQAGIQTVLQAENDPYCLSVLERHWPDVERVWDVRDVVYQGGSYWEEARERSSVRVASTGKELHPQYSRGTCRGDLGGSDSANFIERMGDKQREGLHAGRGAGTGSGIDLVYGGFPCQDLSKAGKGAGLEGSRSGLFFEFARIVAELSPRWIVAENVPGLLSNRKGRDFRIVLSTLDELGYGLAWAVLDSANFGVPQGRRRVYIVGHLGERTGAGKVLSVCESGCGDPQKNYSQREDSTGSGGEVIDYESGQFRRLTPIETERLQGWPDDWTRWGADGKEIPERQRYKMTGNGVTAPVAEWVGQRLMAVNDSLS